MRLPAPTPARPPAPAGNELPPWPPLLATRGPGARSAPHAHHGMHLLLCLAMSRSFRRMLGMPPSALRRASVNAGVRPGR